MLIKIIKKLTASEAGSRSVLFMMSLFRKTGSLSVFNIAYYFNTLDPPAVPGFVTKAGKKGISGIASGSDRNIPVKVDLLVDGNVINTTYAAQKVYYPLKYYGDFIGFYFPMKKVWNHIRKKQKIEVRAEGKPLSFRSGLFSRESVPNYGRMPEKQKGSEKNIINFIRQGRVINKFGRIQAPRNTNKGWLDKVISSFSTVNEIFDKKFGKKLFVFYGGLLGFARNGGLIAHDCDLDLAYFSEETDPDKVRAEFYGIAETLAAEYRGEIYYSDNKINFTKLKQSVTPVWINSSGEFSCTFAYVKDSFKVVKEDILPVREIEYEGCKLNLPANPENIVKYIYGRGWKYPDPGWKWLIEYKTRTPIFRARLTGSQVRKLNKTAAWDNS